MNNCEELINKYVESSQKPVVVILGPTAVGKTKFGIQIAGKLNGEIISADSRQIYKEANIGTDKISVEEMSGVPHHMIDIALPSEVFNAFQFVQKANECIDAIHARKHVPIALGGTMMYIDALVLGFDFGKTPPNSETREVIKRLYEVSGKEGLYAELERLDFSAAKLIHKNNVPYIMRALEKVMLVGTVKKAQNSAPKFDFLKIGLIRPRGELYQRIERRIDEQFSRGLKAEALHLIEKYGQNSPVVTALGYKQFLSSSDDETVKSLLKTQTKNFCKRQMSWWRKDASIHWFNAEDFSEVADTKSIF